MLEILGKMLKCASNAVVFPSFTQYTVVGCNLAEHLGCDSGKNGFSVDRKKYGFCRFVGCYGAFL